jgi:putative SOS response-associated peptidase YedK
MCGRYKVSTKAPQILAAFHVAETAPAFEMKERYNVAPTDAVPVVRMHEDKRALMPMRWGLIPFWAKDMSIGARMLNARAETLFEKPAFRESLEKRRCLVVSDGFYEWQKLDTGKKKPDKQPWLFTYDDGHVFAYAGLWAKWKGPHGTVESCSIITGPPNDLVAPFHDRMPVIFDPARDGERIAAWLDPARKEVDIVALTTPRDLPGFVRYPVDKRVGNVKNDDPTCAAPMPAAAGAASAN